MMSPLTLLAECPRCAGRLTPAQSARRDDGAQLVTPVTCDGCRTVYRVTVVLDAADGVLRPSLLPPSPLEDRRRKQVAA
jgi:RNase P subunit RPR2